MYITLQEIRKQLNLDDFYTEDNDYLIELIKVSEDVVEKRIGKKLCECINPSTGELEPSVKHSILVLVSTYYNQREATSPTTITEVPLTFNFLSDLNKKYYIN